MVHDERFYNRALAYGSLGFERRTWTDGGMRHNSFLLGVHGTICIMTRPNITRAGDDALFALLLAVVLDFSGVVCSAASVDYLP